MDPCNLPAGNSRSKRGRPRHDGDGVSEATKVERASLIRHEMKIAKFSAGTARAKSQSATDFQSPKTSSAN